MKLRFTYHAQSQVLARLIHESQVAEIIRHPDWSGPTSGGAVAYRKKVENGILEVICVRGKHKNEYLVLTMYYL